MTRLLTLPLVLLAACALERAPAAPYAITARGDDGAAPGFQTRSEPTIATAYGRISEALAYTRVEDLPEEERASLCEWTELVGIQLAPLDVSGNPSQVRTCEGWPAVPFYDRCVTMASDGGPCRITMLAWVECVDELAAKAGSCHDDSVAPPTCWD